MKFQVSIFVTIILSLIVYSQILDWNEERKQRKLTMDALKTIAFDLQLDTHYYEMRIERIERAGGYLKLALQKDPQEISLIEFRKILSGLKSNVDYKIRDAGYKSFLYHLDYPALENDTLITMIGGYHSLSTTSGNYNMIQKEHYSIVTENYIKLFEAYPDFLHADTVVSYPAMRKHKTQFLNEQYWKGRIALTHRETDRTMRAVYEKNKNYAVSILDRIEPELSIKLPETFK